MFFVQSTKLLPEIKFVSDEKLKGTRLVTRIEVRPPASS